jgi:hypothetical protein
VEAVQTEDVQTEETGELTEKPSEPVGEQVVEEPVTESVPVAEYEEETEEA